MKSSQRAITRSRIILVVSVLVSISAPANALTIQGRDQIDAVAEFQQAIGSPLQCEIKLKAQQPQDDHSLDTLRQSAVVLQGSASKSCYRRAALQTKLTSSTAMADTAKSAVPKVELFKQRITENEDLPCWAVRALPRLYRVAYDSNLRYVVWKRMGSEELLCLSTKQMRQLETLAAECNMPLSKPANFQNPFKPQHAS